MKRMKRLTLSAALGLVAVTGAFAGVRRETMRALRWRWNRR